MKWKILVTAPRAQPVISEYRRRLGEHGCRVIAHETAERLTEDELLPLIGDVDGIICGDDQISSRVLDAAKRLRVISKWGTGIDSIAVDDARRRGIVVANVPGAFKDPVADTVLGYVLLFARKLDLMHSDMRVGLWQRRALRSLSECTLGIVGLGECGHAVARRAHAFGMTVLAYTLNHSPDSDPTDPHVNMVSFPALLSKSDFVTLHANLRDDNYHMLDADHLALMKPSAVLINTARGALVDEAALVAALRDGRIGGAALDVFENEPLAADSPLREIENVYLAPHNANASVAAAMHTHDASIVNLLNALEATLDR